jgi:hypothetical protein
VVSAVTLAANLASYQTSSGLAATVATLTANNTSFVGNVAANNIVSNTSFLSTRSAVKVANTFIGARSFINFIAGAGAALVGTDNASGNTVDITVSISTNGISSVLSSQSNVTSNAQSVIDSFNANTYRSAQYLITLTDNNVTNYQATNILVVQDGAAAYMTEYASVFTSADLGTFSSNLSAGVISLFYTPTSNNVTTKITKTVTAI